MTAPHLRNPQLVERLREFSGQTVVFHPTPGGAGDSLRQAATYQLFQDLDIRFTLLSETDDITGAIVLIGGGGNLIPAYSSVRKALLRTANNAARVIVLPQSIRGNEDLLEELGPSVEIFCRDPESYVHLLAHRSRAQAHLAHDLAFCIDIDRLRADAGSRVEALFAEKDTPRPLDLLMAESGHRFFFQKSRKRTKRFCPKSSKDISLLFKTGTKPKEAEVGALALLSYLDRTQEVHTDRLHVGIAAAMLGKRVYLYEDSYGIVGGSYRHSLHADYPKVQLIP